MRGAYFPRILLTNASFDHWVHVVCVCVCVCVGAVEVQFGEEEKN